MTPNDQTKLKLIKEIVEAMCNVKIDTKERRRKFVYARFIYYDLSREYSDASTTKIGALVNRDHSTVLYGLKQAKILKSYEDFKNIFNAVESKCLSVGNRIINSKNKRRMTIKVTFEPHEINPKTQCYV